MKTMRIRSREGEVLSDEDGNVYFMAAVHCRGSRGFDINVAPTCHIWRYSCL
jgi:hypothetical protein